MIKLEDSIEDLNKETDRLVAERLKELSKHRETFGAPRAPDYGPERFIVPKGATTVMIAGEGGGRVRGQTLQTDGVGHCDAMPGDVYMVTVGGRTFFENRKPLYPTINPIRKYPGTCPCGIAASACDYHKDA